MKLGPVEIRRYQAAHTERRPKVQEAGASGTINIDGWLTSHEYLRELTGQEGLRVYQRMRRSDPTVREALWHIFAPVLNANFDIEPASDDPADLEVAAFIKAAYFSWPSQPFSVYLRQALDYLTYGFMLFETPLAVVERQAQYMLPDGNPVVVHRQWLTWERFAQRLPATIQRWHTKDGKLESVEQWAVKDGDFGTYRIPADQLLLFVNEQEGDDYTGVSVLRTAYKPWFLADTVQKVAAVAVERHGVGVDVAYMPDRYHGDKAMSDRIETMLREQRSGEFSYMVFPGPKGSADVSGRDGFLFEIVSPPGSLPDLVGFLEYLRGDIKGNVLARFSELGHGSVGARATGDVQSEVWYDSLHAVARYFCDINNQVAIPRLVDQNYDVAEYPTLVAQDIESRNLEEFATAHAKLVLAGAIAPDESYRQFVRRSIDAPDEDEPQETGIEEEPPGPPGERQPEQPEDEMEERQLAASEERPVRGVVRADVPKFQMDLRPEIHVHVPDQPPPVVNVTSPEVRVNVPRQPVPVVNVAAPDMNPIAQAMRALAQARVKRIELERDQAGRLDGAVVKEV